MFDKEINTFYEQNIQLKEENLHNNLVKPWSNISIKTITIFSLSTIIIIFIIVIIVFLF